MKAHLTCAWGLVEELGQLRIRLGLSLLPLTQSCTSVNERVAVKVEIAMGASC